MILGVAGHAVGWPIPKGGSVSITNALLGYFRSLGGDVQTGAPVESLEASNVPDGLNLLWVRSYLQPSVMRFSDDKWIAAAALDRLNHLPGATRPTWLEVLYYERTLLAAVVLVGLCLYATFISPPPKFTMGTRGSAAPSLPS